MIFYELKINYERQTGENNPGAVKETYLVEGITCADVENRLIQDIKPFISGEYEVQSCRKVQLHDLFQHPDFDKWYKARVEMITVDDSGKERRKAVTILVQASSINDAVKDVEKQMAGNDCELISVTKSPILDVYRAID